MKDEARRGAMDVRKSVATPDSLPRSDSIYQKSTWSEGKTRTRSARYFATYHNVTSATHTSNDLIPQPLDPYTLQVNIRIPIPTPSRDRGEPEKSLFELAPRILRFLGKEGFFEFFQF